MTIHKNTTVVWLLFFVYTVMGLNRKSILQINPQLFCIFVQGMWVRIQEFLHPLKPNVVILQHSPKNLLKHKKFENSLIYASEASYNNIWVVKKFFAHFFLNLGFTGLIEKLRRLGRIIFFPQKFQPPKLRGKSEKNDSPRVKKMLKNWRSSDFPQNLIKWHWGVY